MTKDQVSHTLIKVCREVNAFDPATTDEEVMVTKICKIPYIENPAPTHDSDFYKDDLFKRWVQALRVLNNGFKTYLEFYGLDIFDCEEFEITIDDLSDKVASHS